MKCNDSPYWARSRPRTASLRTPKQIMDIVSTTDEDQLIYQDQLKELVEKLKGEIVVLSNDNTELKASVAECINRIKELKELGVDDANV